MRKLKLIPVVVISLLLVYSSVSEAQSTYSDRDYSIPVVSAQAGLGYDKVIGKFQAELGLQLAVQLVNTSSEYKTSGISIIGQGGYEHTIYKAHTLFTGMGGLQYHHGEDEGEYHIQILAGSGYMMNSSDNKSANSTTFVFTVQVDKYVLPDTYLFLKGTAADGHAAMFVGLKYSFVGLRNR